MSNPTGDQMRSTNIIDLCRDEEIDRALKHNAFAQRHVVHRPAKINRRVVFEEGGSGKADIVESRSLAGAATSPSMTDPGSLCTSAFHNLPRSCSAVPLSRQFWKAGEYHGVAPQSVPHGQNRLRVHPKFLHSNATSHKWAFGAIAELLDNAIDEVHNGATFVKIDKIKYSPNGDYALVIQDDGGGMGPESLRRCMGFGFSEKCSGSSIGQYGNGFKTSTMRLGADAIVFSCMMHNSKVTLSVGLLSYTFLTKTGCDDIIIPMVDYELDQSSHVFKRLMHHGQRHFDSNLSALLRWTPFSTEKELLEQFGGIGYHGTKVIVYNLWFNDAGDMELDFTSDEEDIMISGAPKVDEKCQGAKMLNQMHVANRFRYSLRVYASILYLHLPKSFRIILCGRVVVPHHIVNDLKYRECIRYRPQVGGSTEAEVITTIGFLEGAPKLNIYGFNVYHKNRLILPFWPAGSSVCAIGRGISGVLEANFIRPTHDKQDFEKSSLFQRLETRLKEMMVEYWRSHCHLVGYGQQRASHHLVHFASAAAAADSLAAPSTQQCYEDTERMRTSALLDSPSNGDVSRNPLRVDNLMDQIGTPRYPSTSRNVVTALCAEQQLLNDIRSSSHTGEVRKRTSSSILALGASRRKRHSSDWTCQAGSNHNSQGQLEEIRVMIWENKKLKAQCLEYEMSEKQLTLKADKLRTRLQVLQQMCKNLMDELTLMDDMYTTC